MKRLLYRRPAIHKKKLPSKGSIIRKNKLFTEDLLLFHKFTAIQTVDSIKEQTLVNDL